VADLLTPSAKESSHSNQLPIDKSPKNKIVLGGSQAIPDRLQSHGLVLGNRVSEGPRLALQRLEAKLEVGRGIPLSKAANFHSRYSGRIRAQFVPVISALPLTVRVNRIAPMRISKFYDPQTTIRKIPAVLAKESLKTGHRRNLGRFSTRAAAAKHEREVQSFKKA
jgi:hypothetical protein